MNASHPQPPLSEAEQQTALNQAISLYQLGKYREARAALQALVARHAANVTAWNVLGYLNRDIGETAVAAAAFDKALALSPGDPTAVKGRARMAFERSESDVRQRYAAAFALSPGDPRLMLELTEARLGEGDVRAVAEMAQWVERLPGWTEGQIALARMRWETERDEHFADHVRRLLREQPGRVDLWKELIVLLAGCGLFEAAANAARDAQRAVGGDGELALMEAVTAGQACDVARADAAWRRIPPGVPGRAVHQSVHFVRKGELEQARAAIDEALAADPGEIGSWAVAELIYRKLGHERSAWLSGQDGLVQTFDLSFDPGRFEAIKALLRELHRRSPQMVGQSVREGTQTRGRLFDRTEPELAELRRVLESAIADYLAALPPAEPGHPLLRHRQAQMTIIGSWSVRLTGSGYHVSHMHPQGLISSACYFEVPDICAVSDEGHLELGVPSPDMMLDLAPLHVFAPKPGRLVLFPSYLHHGTRPFSAGERLSVAFDVNRHPAPPE